jgi:hypothetical protein
MFCLVSLSGLVFHGYSISFTLDTVNPVVSLLSPDGGETWVSGPGNSISWTAYDSNPGQNSVLLQFSTDAGLSWQSIGSFQPALGQLEWLVPALQTDYALVRIIMQDTFGNTGRDESDSYFSIISAVPSAPQDVRISLYNTTDILITWEAVTTDIYGNSFTPDGYIVLCSNDPSESGQLSLLAVTQYAQFLHLNAASDISKMFYCIIAYQGELPAAFNINNPNNIQNTQYKTSK